MVVIVTVYTAVNVNVSPNATTTFSAAGQVNEQTHESIYLGKSINRDADHR